MTLSNAIAANPEDKTDAMSLIHAIHAQGAWRAIDVQFAQFIVDQTNKLTADKNAQLMGILACALSVELGKGNTCLSLEPQSLNSQPFSCLEIAKHLAQLGLNIDPQKTQQFFQQYDELTQVNWLEVATQSGLVYVENEGNGVNSAESSSSQFTTPTLPLVLDNGRLFLARYWNYEANVANQLKSRAQQTAFSKNQDLVNQKQESKDPTEELELQKAMLDQLFQDDSSGLINWQKVAAAIAITRQFAVISGGPGTGKTTTVVKLLASLLAHTNVDNKNKTNSKIPKIQLVAPTGKAAARLTESIGSAIDNLTIEPELKNLIPRQASTIHRLLGARHNTKAYRHHKNNPLHLDVLVVDEASMVDLPMMSQLLDALPAKAKLILLGDKDQLSSVEAGSVLGDIFQVYQTGYSADYVKCLEDLTSYSLPQINDNQNPVSDSICVLQKSYRFGENSGIGRLARAINQGDIKALNTTFQQASKPLSQKAFNDIALINELEDEADRGELIQLMTQGYQSYLKEAYSEQNKFSHMPDQARNVLNLFAKLRLLCAIREGDCGVNTMNESIEQALIKQGHIINPNNETWYIGKPVMVTRNDGVLGLHNGDIGVCLQDHDSENKALRVYFELPDGSIKGFLPSRIHHYELAFAMTIHKSQGSEFDHTVMLLPTQYTPILTRELIYTGVTRAKTNLTIFSSTQVLEKGIQTPTQRVSGLGEKLKQK